MYKKRMFVIGILNCYSFASANSIVNNTKLFSLIKQTAESMLGVLDKYDRDLITERYIKGKSLSRIAFDRNYKSHTSILKKINSIVRFISKECL